MNRLPELTDWDAMPFSAAEKRRRREAERNAALRGNPDALEKRAREAARKKRQREAAEAERARKRRRKGELRVANSISSAIAAAATNKALSDAAALARYDRLLLYDGGPGVRPLLAFLLPLPDLASSPLAPGRQA